MIGVRNLRRLPKLSNAKLKSIVTWSPALFALKDGDIYLPG